MKTKLDLAARVQQAQDNACDICREAIGPEEGPSCDGACYSASGHEVVCDSCMDDLTDEERRYIEGHGPRAGRWAR